MPRYNVFCHDRSQGTEFPRRSKRDTLDRQWESAAQAAEPPVIPASGQRDQAVPEAGAVNDAAVAAYRLSAQAGNPFSEGKLAQMFGRTSRRWACARITEARRVPPPVLTTEDPAITISAQSRSAHDGTLRDALPWRWRHRAWPRLAPVRHGSGQMRLDSTAAATCGYGTDVGDLWRPPRRVGCTASRPR